MDKVIVGIITASQPLVECLDGLKQQNYSNFDIIINQKEPQKYSAQNLVNKCENVYRNRNELREKLLASDADWFLFLDDDIVLPPQGITELMRHKKEIIGGWVPMIYAQRYVCGKWIADNMLFNFKDVRPSLTKVDFVGVGCMLIHRKVLERVKFEAGVETTYIDAETKLTFILDDTTIFCNRLNELDLPIYVNGDVVCGHLRRT